MGYNNSINKLVQVLCKLLVCGGVMDMALMSLKDYASMNNVTYEAVRQQVVRYSEELGEHIVKDGRQQFLDDEAIAFLDSKRQKNPVTIIQANKDEEIVRLKQEKEKLLIKIATQADKISELSEWKSEMAVQIAQAEQQKLLQEEKTKLAVAAAVQETKIAAEKEKIEAVSQAEDKLKIKLQEKFNQELAKVNAELEAEKQKTWWDKLFGKKKQ